jgi:cytochrome c oxidase assembly factor CtaG
VDSQLDRLAVRFLIAIFLMFACPAWSHDARQEGVAIFRQWAFEPWVVACLLLCALLYVLGAWRLLHRMRHGRRRFAWQCLSFAAGWLALVAALISPLDALGGWLFSAHMLQHELLMIVAAPFLVLGRPLAVWLWAFSSQRRQRTARVARWPLVSAVWSTITHPVVAWLLHAAVLWLWHVPALFQAALSSNPLHVVQHLSFFLSALLFWWAIIGESSLRPSRGGAMLFLFTTMLHTGALGALLTVSDGIWYPAYDATNQALGMDPLEDQQLGGLIMWIPGALAYVAGGLALGMQWLSDRETSSTVRMTRS